MRAYFDGMVKHVILSATLLCCVRWVAAQDSTAFDDLLIRALLGDMSKVLDAMDTLQEPELTAEQAVLKRRFNQRFRTQVETYQHHTADSGIVAIERIYQYYWRNAMLNNGSLAKHDKTLITIVCAYLQSHDPRMHERTTRWIRWHYTEVLQAYLKNHGCYSAVGKTGQFYDLLLHGAETAMIYPITTPEDTVEVKVVFMDSVISHGWEGYATFDTYYPGGWTTSDALYCARASYDLESEEFRISYLMHEGKHFADFKRFPKLQSADLEYRAKLVELSAADITLFDLIDFFLKNKAYDADNPHAYANYCVMRDLSKRLFKRDSTDDLADWKTIPVSTINNASREILLKNTRDLYSAGATKVKRFIK